MLNTSESAYLTRGDLWRPHHHIAAKVCGLLTKEALLISEENLDILCSTLYFGYIMKDVRFEVFTAVIMKYAVF
jgi:hypothetical protein